MHMPISFFIITLQAGVNQASQLKHFIWLAITHGNLQCLLNNIDIKDSSPDEQSVSQKHLKRKQSKFLICMLLTKLIN
jgi:hypothetical protein